MRSRRLVGIFFVVAAAVTLITSPPSRAAELVVKVIEKSPPKEVAEPLRAVLSSKVIQLLNGDKPAFEIWLRSEVPLKSKPTSADDTLSAMAEITLMGAIVVSDGGFRDYKDNEIPKGTYTARFGLQPQDGNHLGTAEFNYFLILLAPDADKELDGFKQAKSMIKASGTLTSSGHPVVVSLRPAKIEAGTPKLTEPIAEHKALRLKVAGKTSAGDKADVGFDLIYKGTGHIQ